MQWELPEPEPLVSILIPNKDHVDDLEKCLFSLYSKTLYEAFEVIVIENNSTDPATKAYYEKLPDRYANCRVVAYSGGSISAASITLAASLPTASSYCCSITILKSSAETG